MERARLSSVADELLDLLMSNGGLLITPFHTMAPTYPDATGPTSTGTAEECSSALEALTG